jgi:hypothetical protein
MTTPSKAGLSRAEKIAKEWVREHGWIDDTFAAHEDSFLAGFRAAVTEVDKECCGDERAVDVIEHLRALLSEEEKE